jgi:hypothetical protein
LLAANADHLVSAIEGVSHHVAPELSGRADNANAVGMIHGGMIRACHPVCVSAHIGRGRLRIEILGWASVLE